MMMMIKMVMTVVMVMVLMTMAMLMFMAMAMVMALMMMVRMFKTTMVRVILNGDSYGDIEYDDDSNKGDGNGYGDVENNDNDADNDSGGNVTLRLFILKRLNLSRFSKQFRFNSHLTHVQQSAPSTALQTAPYAVVISLLLLCTCPVLPQHQFTVHRSATARALVTVRQAAVQTHSKALAVEVYHTQLAYLARATVFLVAMPTVHPNVAKEEVDKTGLCLYSTVNRLGESNIQMTHEATEVPLMGVLPTSVPEIMVRSKLLCPDACNKPCSWRCPITCCNKQRKEINKKENWNSPSLGN